MFLRKVGKARKAAILRAVRGGTSVSTISGVAPSTIYRWMRQERENRSIGQIKAHRKYSRTGKRYMPEPVVVEAPGNGCCSGSKEIPAVNAALRALVARLVREELAKVLSEV